MRQLQVPTITLKARPVNLKFQRPNLDASKYDKDLLLKEDAAQGEIAILGEIGFAMFGGTDAKMVKESLDAHGDGPLVVLLNSPGGDAFEGVAIYNLLRSHPGKITVKVLGLAASAASVIAMAGDRIEMGDGAQMMIHSAWGIVAGNQDDLRDFAELLDGLDRSVADLYSKRTGLTVASVLALMKAETWMTAKESVEEGFADAQIDYPKKKNKPKQQQHLTTPVLSQLADPSRAASGARVGTVQLSAARPGVAGPAVHPSTQGAIVKPIAKQIADFEAKRAASTARMSELMTLASGEGRTLAEAEITEYDNLKAEVKQIDDHLVRLRDHEATVVAAAEPVPAAPIPGATRPAAGEIIVLGPRLEKGIPFTRYVKALAMARGSLTGALAIAKANQHWKDTSPQVEKVLMTAVAGGDTTSAGWASELVYNQNLVAEFIEMLRPQTIVGKIAGITKVPFNIRMSGQDSGSSAYWVGQGKPVPVSKLHTLEVTLGIAKAAGLVVLTEELVRSSAPSAELLVRNDLAETIREFQDVQFVDPNVAAVSNVSPASVTNGVTPVTPTGTSLATLRADVQTLFKTWIQNHVDPSSGVWIMETTQALAISLMQNALGQSEFPGLTMNGGVFFGLPVITSMSANIPGSPDSGKMIILASAKDILLADDGGLTIDASREASIEMLDNPTNDAAAGTPTTMVSMFQTNSVAIKAVRFMNWKKRRSTAVQYIKEAQYVA